MKLKSKYRTGKELGLEKKRIQSAQDVQILELVKSGKFHWKFSSDQSVVNPPVRQGVYRRIKVETPEINS